jgi:hypothetical protein
MMMAMAAVPRNWVWPVVMVCVVASVVVLLCDSNSVCITKTKAFWEAFVLQLHQEVFLVLDSLTKVRAWFAKEGRVVVSNL